MLQGWGLGPSDLKPDLVYTRISGYGQVRGAGGYRVERGKDYSLSGAGGEGAGGTEPASQPAGLTAIAYPTATRPLGLRHGLATKLP